jgi:hypothetical protein
VTAQTKPPTPPPPAAAPAAARAAEAPPAVVPPTPPVLNRPAQAQGGDPLFVIDGVVQGRKTKLDAVVSKLHVGTIEVLKPADAVRRFGERARFGAVLVTTVPPDESADLAQFRSMAKDLEKISKLEKDELAVKLRAQDLELTKEGIEELKRSKAEFGKRDVESVAADKAKADLGSKIKQAGAVDPIFIIDGVIFEPGFAPLKDLDPAFIDSVEVLKGNGAVAVYGERARQGVIIIKLKH